MSEVKWTNEQLQAINEKGSNILVAAAAGSGKTAVLVERVIHKIIDEKIDIDKMLIVTFTNAAASEMREKILEAIYKKLEKEPQNTHLQRQITLLNKASICTIHAFCLEVIHNHFYELNLPSNFRIADTAEIDLLKQEVLDDLFEQKYIEADGDFLSLLEMFTKYNNDDALQELILNIYKFIQSCPFPEKWLEEKIEMFSYDPSTEFSETTWGKLIFSEVIDQLEDSLCKLQKANIELAKYPECQVYYETVDELVVQIQDALENGTTWNSMYEKINNITIKEWKKSSKITVQAKKDAKEVRDNAKDLIKNKLPRIISSNQEEIAEDFRKIYVTLKKLQKLILEFSHNFSEKKMEKNCIDFNDIEHFALKILLDENGEKTEVAKKYVSKFNEIAIDEYQDSNLVQEEILTSISNGNNIFMVGDVKQSIYKFRQAMPELFLQKYTSYKSKEEIESNKDNLKIQLFRNFRSRNNVLDITNLVFEAIMSSELGDIDYNENEYLNYGANYPEPDETLKQEENKDYAGIAEINIIDLKEDEVIMAFNDDDDEQTFRKKSSVDSSDDYSDYDADAEKDKEIEKVEDEILEARFVAKRIKELLESNYNVYDKNVGYRKIEPKDIVILLRATQTLAPIYEKELSDLDLPVFSDSSASYLESVEIETILSVLKIIDNPMQDIPLVVVLRSSIGDFTDNDLVTIRLTDRNCNFYEALLKARISTEGKLKDKIETLLQKLEEWKAKSEYLPLNELIWQIYLDTGFYQYVGLLPNGAMRQANLKTLFEKAKQYETASFKGLFNFINFIERLKKQNGDLSSAKLIGESANVIRIMSIHKSKGLEFPVVFLCNTQKRFNLMDLNNVILMHQDLGFGATIIEPDKNIKYSTETKQAIRLKIKQETLSEEERILYVALTRAKEKLIITGRSKDLQNELDAKRNNVLAYGESEDIKIDSKLMKKCNSYLDWLEYVYLFNEGKTVTLKGKKMNLSDIVQLKTYLKDDLIEELQKEDVEEENTIDERIKKEVEKQENEEVEKLKEDLQWNYEYEVDTKLSTKTSVSKLKQEQTDKLVSVTSHDNWEDDGNTQFEDEWLEKTENEIKHLKIDSLEENIKITPAKRGTLVHLCVQKLDENKDYTLEDVQELVKSLVEKEIITEEEAGAIDCNLIYSYTQTPLFNELKQAKEVHKEQPFYINIPAKEIFEEAKQAKSNKNVLVQGVIDLYYIDNNGKLHLVDYKTDYVPVGKEIEIAKKYTVQLEIYKKALEQTLNIPVETSQICLANCNWKLV